MLERLLFSFVLDVVVSTSSNGSLNATLPANGPYCVESRSWLRSDLFPKHCITAAVQFLHHEAAEYQYKPIEFLMPDAKPLSSMETRATRRRYVYCKLKCTASHAMAIFVGHVRPGQLEHTLLVVKPWSRKIALNGSAIDCRHYLKKCLTSSMVAFRLRQAIKTSYSCVKIADGSLTVTCTMAIVMLKTFRPMQVPHLNSQRSFPPTDIGSYGAIWDATRRIIDGCLSPYCEGCQQVDFTSGVGWEDTGS